MKQVTYRIEQTRSPYTGNLSPYWIYVFRNNRCVGRFEKGGDCRILVTRNGADYIFARGKTEEDMVRDMETRKTYLAGTKVEVRGYCPVVMPVKGFDHNVNEDWEKVITTITINI